jgi:DNA primase
MGKYVSNISEIILDAVDLEDLISGYVTLKRAGSNIKGLCPFHNEKTPSFVVSKEKQFYHCFGCGASGNAIGFIMAIENLDFLDAIEFLADRSRLDLDQYMEQHAKVNYKPENKDLKKKYQDISKHAARFFYMKLKESDVAKEYFKNRGISEATIKTFGLGYALDEWRSLLNYLGKPPYTPAELEKVGLVIRNEEKKSYYDRFRGRVMFPIIDVQGKVVGFGGRIMGDGQPKYLNSPETPIFNKSNTLYNLNLAKNNLEDNILIVVEGYMDVIALYQAGIKNVVATLGTALTPLHGRLLKRYAEEIIIAYDSDSAGQKATERSVQILDEVGIKARVLTLSEGLDPDDYIKKYGVDTLKTKLKKALNYTDYKIHLLRQKYNLDFVEERRRFYLDCVELIRPMQQSALKDQYVRELAKWTHMAIDAIKRDVFSESTEEVQVKRPVNKKKKSKLFVIEARILYLGLISKESFDKLFKLINFDDIEDSRIKKILTFLKGFYQVMDKFSIEPCIDHLTIDDIKFIQLLLEKSVAPEDVDREIQVNTVNFKSEIMNSHIIRIVNRIMRVKASDELSETERESQLKLLNVRLAEMKKEQAQLMKTLGR